jgi:hypothetical protein
MKLKHLLFPAALTALLGGLALTIGCERELPQPQPPAPTVQASGLPAYTADKYATLLASTTDEADLVAKTRLLAYTLTRYLGEHAPALDIIDAAGVERVLPCEQTWLGNDGNLRLLGTATGQSDAAVEAGLSAIIASRISGLPVQGGHFDVLLGSLTYQGVAYTTRNYYPAADPATAEAILVSYGVSYREAGYVALGYRYALPSGPLSYVELPVEDALAEGVLLLDAVEVDPLPGVERFNDPCHVGLSNGGGGSNGGSGGSSNLDDDGSQRGYLDDPLITGNGVCTNWSGPTYGLRVAEFHLADRNEGGLFGGKSEVYASITVYNAADPAGTYKTNENGQVKNIQGYQYRRGIQLDEVPASTVSSTSQTIRTANGRNWTLLGDGICPSGGYDRFIVTFFEFDGPEAPWVFDGFIDLPNIYFGDYHWLEMAQQADVWFTNDITPAITLAQIQGNGGFLFLAETAGGYNIVTTQPTAQRSWFKIELF